MPNSELITFLPSKGRSKFVIRASSTATIYRRNTNRAFHGIKSSIPFFFSSLSLTLTLNREQSSLRVPITISTSLIKDPRALVREFQFKKLKSSTRGHVPPFDNKSKELDCLVRRRERRLSLDCGSLWKSTDAPLIIHFHPDLELAENA